MKTRKSLVIILGLFLSIYIPSIGQRLDFELEITEFSWSGLVEDGEICVIGTCIADPAYQLNWQLRTRDNGSVITIPTTSNTHCWTQNNGGASGSIDRDFSWDYTHFLNDYDMNLCGDAIWLYSDLDAYENETGPFDRCGPRNSDLIDDFETRWNRDQDFNLKSYSQNVWHTITHTAYDDRPPNQDATYTITYRIRYSIALLRPTVTPRNNDGDPQDLFCEGDPYQLWIDYNDGRGIASGHTGTFQWERSFNNAPWSVIPGVTTRNLPVTATSPPTRYRVTQVGNCLKDPFPGPREAPARKVVPAPPDPNNILYDVVQKCPGSTNEIRIRGISNYDQNTTVRFTLTNSAGNVVANIPNRTAAQLAANPEFLTGLISGTYTLKVTSEALGELLDDNELDEGDPEDRLVIANCTKELQVTVSNLPPTEITNVMVNSPGCAGDDGTIEVTYNTPGSATIRLMKNGNPIASFTTSGGQHIFTVPGPLLSTDVYSVFLFDQRDCGYERGNLQFTVPAPLSGNLAINEIIKCKDGRATIQLTGVSGGSGNYTLEYLNNGTWFAGLWFAANTYVDDTWTLVGTFDFQLRDIVQQCTYALGSLTFDEPDVALSLSAENTSASACADNGTITLTALGGEGDYTYRLNGTLNMPDDNNVFIDVPDGPHSVSVEDERGCVVTIDVTVDKDPNVVVGLVEETKFDLTCFESMDGSFEVEANGGSGSFMYAITTPIMTTPDASGAFTGLAADTYVVTATDSRGCTGTFEVTIDQPNPFEIVYLDILPIRCFGNKSTVTIGYTPRGDINPLFNQYDTILISLDNGATYTPYEGLFDGTRSDVLISDVDPGMYILKIKNAAGCESDARPFEITEPTELVPVIDSITNLTCNGSDDGEIHFNIQGGTPPYDITFGIAGLSGASMTLMVSNPGPYTITSLAAEDYVVTIADDNGCDVTFPSVSITEPDLLTLDLSNSGPNIDCSGNNGEITATATGGTQPYMYSLDNVTFQPSIVLSGAEASNTVYLKDANDCTFEANLDIAVDPFDPAPAVTVIDSAVAGCQDATIRVDFTPNAYGFEWTVAEADDDNIDCSTGVVATQTTTAGIGTLEIADLEPGQYIICVTSEICSAGPFEFEIAEVDSLKLVAAQIDPVLCNGDSTGSITLNVTGGQGPFTIQQNNANPQMGSTATYDGLPAGTNFYSVTDSKGCTFGIAFEIPEVNAIVKDSETVNQVTCNGADNGLISFTASGGTSPLTAQVSIDGGGFDAFALDPEVGGQQPIELDNLAPGEYSVKIVDANDCEKIYDYTITEPTLLTLDAMISTTSCIGIADGVITVTGANGTGNLTYAIANQPFAAANVFSGLAAGPHVISVKDENDCIITETFVVDEPAELTATIATEPVQCFGNDDGTITINAAGGTPGYSYALDGGIAQASSTFEGLALGTYQVEISDTNGCSITIAEISIGEPALLTSTTQLLTEATCQAGGSAEVIVNGGNAPYSVIWNQDPSLNTQVVENLSGGIHFVQITDAKGCTTQDSVEITAIGVPFVALRDFRSPDCDINNGWIRVGVNNSEQGPFTFELDGTPMPSATFTDLAAGLYQIKVTDSLGCFSMRNIRLPEAELPALSIVDQTAEACGQGDGAVTLEPSGGDFPYSLSMGGVLLDSNTITGLSHGTHTVRVTDNKNCFTELEFEIDSVGAPEVAVTRKSDDCGRGDGELIIEPTTANGPFTFAWAHDATLATGTASNLDFGVYEVTVTNSRGCSSVYNEEVPQTSAPEITMQELIDEACAQGNGSIEVSVSNPGANLTVAWSHTASTALTQNDLTAGAYFVEVSNELGCIDTMSFTIEDVAFPDMTIEVDQKSCDGGNGRIALTPAGEGPYEFLWSHDSLLLGGVAEDLAEGPYSVFIRSANGCTQQFDTTIVLGDAFGAEIDTIFPATCGEPNGSIALNTLGEDLNYTWSHDTALDGPIATSLPFGTYTVLVSAGDACVIELTAAIPNEGAASLTLLRADSAECGLANGSAEIAILGGSGEVSATWYTLDDLDTPLANGPSLDGALGGTYRVVATDETGCSSQLDVEIPVAGALQVTVAEVVVPSCAGAADGSATVTVLDNLAGVTFLWNDPAAQTTANAVNLPTGSYTVTVEAPGGCATIVEVVIGESESHHVSLELLSQPNCFGDATGRIGINVEGGNGSLQYLLNGEAIDPIEQMDSLEAGFYQIAVTDSLGCMVTDSILIEDPDMIALEFEVTDGACDQSSAIGAATVIASGGDGNYTYLWDDIQMQQTATATELVGGFYWVIVSDSSGCSVRDSIEVKGSSGTLNLHLSGDGNVLLCQGEQHYVELPDSAGLNYSWTGPNGFASDAASLYLPENGMYVVRAEQADCSVSDTIVVTSTDESLNALFILPTRVLAGDTVVAVEVSWPVPDAINWFFDTESITHIPVDNNTHYFIFPGVGTFDISLQGTIGNCLDFITKTVEVVSDSAALDFPIDPGTRSIKSVQILPNPNNGQFTLEVELYSAADIRVQVTDLLGSDIDSRVESGSDRYSVNYDLSLQSGVHAITIQVKGERKTLMFLAN